MILPKEFWQGWSVGYPSAQKILELLEEHRPKKILDLGSGYSTVMLGLWAKENKAEVISLEQSQLYLNKTRQLLNKYDLDITVHYAPLTETPNGLFYEYDLPDDIDFAIIDGPAWTKDGRRATFHQIYPHLSKNFVVWVDDSHRDLDTIAREEWLSKYPVKVTFDNGRGVVLQ